MPTRPATELIRLRYSCRTYKKLPIPDEPRLALEKAITNLPLGPFGCPGRFKFTAAQSGDRRELRGLATYGFIRNAQAFIIGAVPAAGADGQADPYNLVDFGYRMERLVIAATGLDLGTCWMGGSFTRGSFARRIEASRGEIIPTVTALGLPADQPFVLDRTVRKAAHGNSRYGWEMLFFADKPGAPLTPDTAGSFALPLEMVRLAPSASNKQPWRVIREETAFHFFMQRTPGYREQWIARLLGVADMQLIDLGIALCHFEMAAREAGLPGRWVKAETTPACAEPPLEYIASWIV